MGSSLDPDVADLVSRSPLPALVVDVADKRIIAASRSALALLAPVAEPVVGRAFEEYMADPPSGAFELLRAGRINGFETRRTVRARDAGPVQMWVRALGDETPPRYALTVVVAGRPQPLPPAADEVEAPAAVVGTGNADLVVDRISSDVRPLLGRAPEDVVDRSILRLVHQDDTPALLWGLAESALRRAGVTLGVRVEGADGQVRLCQLLVTPLVPPPSFAFVLLPGEREQGAPQPPADVERLMRRLGRGIELAAVSRSMSAFPREGVPGLARLTAREIDIVGRLMAGDRVPAIAVALFISQSTVRNHLSAVFGKLRVGSQQELVALLRETDGPPRPP
jgi:DNA-binding CsgD family transcriptional regulator